MKNCKKNRTCFKQVLFYYEKESYLGNFLPLFFKRKFALTSFPQSAKIMQKEIKKVDIQNKNMKFLAGML